MSYYFTSESVSSGHPDKVADQISDAILDECLRQDSNSHVACETLVTTGQCIVSGEITTEAYVDIQKTVRNVINCIGYTDANLQFSGDSCGVLSAIHEQSPDISMGVNREQETEQGAGDQGIMFGYAIKNGINYMPLEIMLSHRILQILESFRFNYFGTGLRPDAKSQVTIEYDEHGNPVKIDTIVVSHQHTPNIGIEDVREWVEEAIKTLINESEQWAKDLFYDYKLLVNPTGQFIIGGPHGDTGLTGRKIIVDTYGGRCPHGGGAFSGKDPSKVDRSAAYMCRYVAKNIVAAGLCDECTIQVSYGIGIAKPISVFVNTHNTNHTRYSDYEIGLIINNEFDFTPYGIIKTLKLKNPIYSDTASYGHFGREPYIDDFGFEHFTWEKLDRIEELKTKYLN